MGRPLDFQARLCLAMVFVQSIPGKISCFEATAAAITAKGLPEAPWLLGAAIALMALGSLQLLLGRNLQLAAICLLVFLISTTLSFHLDLSPMTERIALVKKGAIVDGLLWSSVAFRATDPASLRPQQRKR